MLPASAPCKSCKSQVLLATLEAYSQHVRKSHGIAAGPYSDDHSPASSDSLSSSSCCIANVICKCAAPGQTSSASLAHARVRLITLIAARSCCLSNCAAISVQHHSYACTWLTMRDWLCSSAASATSAAAACIGASKSPAWRAQKRGGHVLRPRIAAPPPAGTGCVLATLHPTAWMRSVQQLGPECVCCRCNAQGALMHLILLPRQQIELPWHMQQLQKRHSIANYVEGLDWPAGSKSSQVGTDEGTLGLQ